MFEWSDKRISRSCVVQEPCVKEENKQSLKIWNYIRKMHRSFSDRMLQRQSSDKTTFRSNLSFRHPRREWVRELNYYLYTKCNRLKIVCMNVIYFTNNSSFCRCWFNILKGQFLKRLFVNVASITLEAYNRILLKMNQIQICIICIIRIFLSW